MFIATHPLPDLVCLNVDALAAGLNDMSPRASIAVRPSPNLEEYSAQYRTLFVALTFNIAILTNPGKSIGAPLGQPFQSSREFVVSDQSNFQQMKSSPNTAALFASGLTLHNAGRLTEAEKIYDKILTNKPDHFDCFVPAERSFMNAVTARSRRQSLVSDGPPISAE
jgi:hypothetical protein